MCKILHASQRTNLGRPWKKENFRPFSWIRDKTRIRVSLAVAETGECLEVFCPPFDHFFFFFFLLFTQIKIMEYRDQTQEEGEREKISPFPLACSHFAN